MTDSPSPQEENEILGMDTDSGPSAGHYCSLYNETIGQLEATLENNVQLQEQLKTEKSSNLRLNGILLENAARLATLESVVETQKEEIVAKDAEIRHLNSIIDALCSKPPAPVPALASLRELPPEGELGPAVPKLLSETLGSSEPLYCKSTYKLG